MDDELLFRAQTGAATPSELNAIDAWRRARPEHERRYQELARLLDLVTEADQGRMAARDRPPVTDVVAGRRARWAPRRGWLVAVAAAVLMATAGASLWIGREPTLAPAFGVDELVTGPGETATVTLRDGSVVRLAPRSRFRVEDLVQERSVFLRGRAYFSVAPRSDTPFRIRSPSGEVTVLGTRFDLEAGGDDLRVLVLQGRVSVSAGRERREVRAGEMGRIVNGTLPVVSQVAGIDRLVEWKGDFLAFQSTPLRQAAREIELQYGVTILIADTVLAARTVTSWFAGWTVGEVLEVVCAIAHAQCVTDSDVVTMTPQTLPGSTP